MNVKRKLLVLLGIILIGLFAVRMVGATDKAATDTGYLGADQWIIQTDGDLQPATDSSQDIGESGSEVNELFVDYITLGEVQKSSWGSVISPMTDQVGHVETTDGDDHLKLFDDGDITIGGAVETDVQLTWDGNAQDFYIGLDDSEDELQIGYGGTLSTTMMLTFFGSRDVYFGDGTDNDNDFVFDGNAQDFAIGIDESDELLTVSYGTSVSTQECFSIEADSAPMLILYEGIDASGATDIDYGSGDVTTHDFISDGGTLTLDGDVITLGEAETIDNSTDDTVMFTSDNAALTLGIYSASGDANLLFKADTGNAAGEQWRFVVDSATQDLWIQNDDGGSGSLATVFTIADGGEITTTDYIDQNISDSDTSTVRDVAKFTHTSTGTPASGFGLGLNFLLEDASENGAEKFASIDFVHGSTPTNGAEDVDMIIYLESAGTEREVLRIDIDEAAAGTSVLEFTGWSQGTNAIIDQVEFIAETTGDTSVDGFGMGIVFKLEDEDDAVEEHASMDIILTDAGSSAEDCDIAFRQSVNSTLTDSLLLDADAGLDLRVSGWDLIFPGDETIDNDTANTLTVRSNDEATTLTIMGFTDKAAKLILDSDLGADGADTWTLEAEDGGNLTLDNDTTEILEITGAGNLQIDGDLSVDGGDLDTDDAYLKILTASTSFHKYHYYPIGYLSATVARVGGGAEPLLCAGLAGVDEIGSTQGYVTLSEDADFLRFRFALPETFIDTGTTTDLVIQFYVDEQMTIDAVTYDVAIYEFGATTPIITDQITMTYGQATGWIDLVTLSTGIGADTDIDADDILIITLSPESNPVAPHNANIYGCRIKYATGIEATE